MIDFNTLIPAGGRFVRIALPLFLTTILIDPQLLQDPHHRAPVSECRLQKIEPDERREPEPQRADVICQQQTYQYK
jgi:hypothetical protein